RRLARVGLVGTAGGSREIERAAKHCRQNRNCDCRKRPGWCSLVDRKTGGHEISFWRSSAVHRQRRVRKARSRPLHPGRGTDQGLTGATGAEAEQAAATINRPTEVTMSNNAGSTEHGQTPLMFIHGAWLSARSWENYLDYFGTCGYAVSAPEWPRKQGDV